MENISDTEVVVNIKLDAHQNKLLAVDLIFQGIALINCKCGRERRGLDRGDLREELPVPLALVARGRAGPSLFSSSSSFVFLFTVSSSPLFRSTDFAVGIGGFLIMNLPPPPPPSADFAIGIGGFLTMNLLPEGWLLHSWAGGGSAPAGGCRSHTLGLECMRGGAWMLRCPEALVGAWMPGCLGAPGCLEFPLVPHFTATFMP